MAGLLNESTIKAQKTSLLESYKKDIASTEAALGRELKFEQKLSLAQTSANTKEMLLNEATQVAGIGPYKRYALDMLKVAVPNNIISDLVSEQAIDNMYSMINYKKFVYGSNKGQTKAGTTFASALALGQSDPNYAKKIVDNEVLATSAEAATAVTGFLAWTPVTAGSVTITTGAVVATDDGAGKLTGTGVTSGTIDYATGAYSITFTSASTVPVIASYGYDNVTAPVMDVPEIELKITSVPVIAQPVKLKTNYSFDAAFVLKKEYGEDVEASLAAEAAVEIMNELTVEVVRDLYGMSTANQPVSFEKIQSSAVSVLDQYDGFMAVLEDAAEEIKQATRRVRPNWIIAGTKVTAIIRTMRQFTASGTVLPGSQQIGTLGDFKVFSCPDLPVDQFVMGWKGNGFLEAGYVYAPYMPILPTDLIVDDTFTGKRGWAAYYGKAKLNPLVYVRGKVVTR